MERVHLTEGSGNTPKKWYFTISLNPPPQNYTSNTRSFSRTNIMMKIGGLASVAVLTTLLVFLSSSTVTRPVLGARLPRSQNNEKLAQIRDMAKEAGLPEQSGLSIEEVCLDEGCLDAALDILSAMNASVDPCKDFYQYSCGRWLATNPVPGTSSRWSRFNRLRDGVNNVTQQILNEEPNDEDARPINQVKEYFKICMDLETIESAGLQPLFNIIGDFGGWQLLNPGTWNNTAFDWVSAVAEVRRRTLVSAILGVAVNPDLKNTTKQAVYLDQPGLGLPRGVLISPENYTTLIGAYQQYIVSVAQELGSVQNEAELKASAQEIIDFEVAIAKLTSSDEARYDMERIYNPYSLKDYQEVTDGFDGSFTINWKKYLDQVFSSSGVTISENEPVVVQELEYNKNLIPLLKNTDPATVSNYIVWRLVANLVPQTTAAMRNITFKFDQVRSGLTAPQPRNVVCANNANNVFGMAVGVKYIEAVFDKEAKAEVESLVENLRAAFKEMVVEAEWMQTATKLEAIAKADAIRSFMAYPDWLEDKEAVEEFYKGLELSSTFFATQLGLNLYRMHKGLQDLRKPTDRDQWVMEPGVVNAAYWPELNSIFFPSGILQVPFFGHSRPKNQNYGGIGVVIGHEITHGFDNQGAQFDKDGNAENWWDDVTKAEYDRRAKCISDQYSGFFAKEANMYVNGELTLGENIADNGGLGESYRAYQRYVQQNGKEGRLPGLEHLSTDQLFFLGYANIWCENITPEGLENQILTDPHSPAEFRVKGPLRNSMEFAEAWNCPVDADGMNPPVEDKCAVW